MIILKHPVLPEELPFDIADFPEQTIFFDIETTGLSHRTSHLYMIGAIFRNHGEVEFIQWFLQKPSEEKEVLIQFTELLKEGKTLIHYNGQSFDIPYLQDRCAYWDLDDPFADCEKLQSLDLYRELRYLKQILLLPSMKQKDMEMILHFPRKDRMSGKELIRVYQDYLQTADEHALELLLLHNHDDLFGMLSIYRLYNWLLSPAETCELQKAEIAEDQLQIILKTAAACPIPLSISTDRISLQIMESSITLSVSGIRGCFRHYYSNYKDYFYLPLEDTAIHKSVGIYVDPSCREKAKADTCYTKKEGLFFFQPVPVFLPEFRQDRRKGPSYFISDPSVMDSDSLCSYAAELIHYLLR